MRWLSGGAISYPSVRRYLLGWLCLCVTCCLHGCSNEQLGAKDLKKCWAPKKLARALATTKNKWSSSCTLGAHIKKDTWVMECWSTFFKGADNPKGCGPFFGLTTADGTDRKNQLKVNWCDGSKVPIDQVLSWECPPTGTRVRLCMHIYRHIYIYTYNSYVSMWCACVTITLTCLT